MCKLLNYPVDALSSILWKCEVNQQSAELSEISTVKKRSVAGRDLDRTVEAKKFIVFWKKNLIKKSIYKVYIKYIKKVYKKSI